MKLDKNRNKSTPIVINSSDNEYMFELVNRLMKSLGSKEIQELSSDLGMAIRLKKSGHFDLHQDFKVELIKKLHKAASDFHEYEMKTRIKRSGV